MVWNLDWNLISIVSFYVIIFALIFIFRSKLEIQSKILFLFKTKRFNRLLERVAALNPKIWRALGLFGIFVGFVGMFLIFGYLGYALVKTFLEPSLPPTVSLVLPGIRVPGSSVFIPFWYGIIALFVVIVVHEGMHGIISEAFKIKVKSSGFGLLAVLPIAFVEPDESKLSKSSTRAQLSIFSAGALGNVLAAGFFLLFAFGLAPIVNSTIEPQGLYIDSVTTGLPAAEAGLKPGMIITELNDENVTKAENFVTKMAAVKPGDIIKVRANNQTYQIKTIENPTNKSKAYIGIYFKQNVGLKSAVAKFGLLAWLPWHLLNLFYWIFTLNLGIGIINLLPLGPIDGGRMANLVIARAVANKNKAKMLSTFITTLSLILLIGNIVGPLLR
ncbi:MAG: site-2 protease family protein [Candidatus Nanoarchaeia archaeon]